MRSCRTCSETDRVSEQVHYSDEWDFALNNISAEDIFYLSAVKTLLSRYEGSPMYEEIAGVIDFVAGTQGAGKSRLLPRIAVPPAPKATVDAAVWKTVVQALQENRAVEFDYNGRWNAQTTHRKVLPYQILIDGGMYFLFGYATEREAERLFSLGRIRNLVLTDERFALPEDYDFSSRCGGGRFGLFMSDNAVKFAIDFYDDARQYVKDFVWADDQVLTDFDDEEKTRIEFSSSQVLRVTEWILAQGSNAVPVAPDWFVQEWRGYVRRMWERAK